MGRGTAVPALRLFHRYRNYSCNQNRNTTDHQFFHLHLLLFSFCAHDFPAPAGIKCYSAQQSSEKGNGLSPISREALRKSLVKYEERHAGVCADPCISIVTNEIS